MLDPNAKEYDPKGGGGFKDLTKPGTYLLGFRKALKHDKTANGKTFSRISIVVIDGPHKGESFTDRIFRDSSAYKRLALICRAARVTERWDPSKAKEVERVLIGRALKAKVEVEEGHDGKEYAQLKYPELEWTEGELATMRAWEAAYKKRKKEDIGPPIDDPDDPGPGSSNEFDDSDDFGDDDIPF